VPAHRRLHVHGLELGAGEIQLIEGETPFAREVLKKELCDVKMHEGCLRTESDLPANTERTLVMPASSGRVAGEGGRSSKLAGNRSRRAAMSFNQVRDILETRGERRGRLLFGQEYARLQQREKVRHRDIPVIVGANIAFSDDLVKQASSLCQLTEVREDEEASRLDVGWLGVNAGIAPG
jgi:hypothetical protein